jgi:universal stress protein A
MSIFRRILVPHDFSAHATRALELAADVARAHRGRLLVLHVITPYQPPSRSSDGSMTLIPEELIAGERRHLEALVARTLRGRKAPPVECRAVLGDPFHCITAAAREADSIVMATAGRTGLPHLLIGSVAEKVVRHAPVPVLTLRPRGRGPKAAARRRRARRATRRS